MAGADPRQGRPRAAGGDQGGGAGPVPPRGHPGAARAGRLPRHGRLLRGRVHPVQPGQPAARGHGGRDPGAAGAQRPGHAGAGQLRAAAGAGALHRHPRLERGRHRGVPGGQDVPAPGVQPAPWSPLGPGPAAGQPAGRPAAPAATGRGLPRALPPLRGRRLPAAPAPGRHPGAGPGSSGRPGPVDSPGQPTSGSATLPHRGPSPEPGRCRAPRWPRWPRNGPGRARGPPRWIGTGRVRPARADSSIRCPRSRSAGSSPGRRSGCRSRCPWWPA